MRFEQFEGGVVASARRTAFDPRVISVLAVVASWQFASMSFSSGLLPGLDQLAKNLSVVLSGSGRFEPGEHVPITVARIVLGFAVAMLFGVVLGITMGVRRRAEQYLLTTTLMLLGVPAVVWAFVLLSWFGLTTMLVPVVTIVLITLPYVTINVWEGTRDVDYRLVEMADTFGATRRQCWRDVYLPHLGPYLFSTLRIAFAISWKIVLIAEMFGTSHGVGFAINYYFSRDSVGMVIAWALPVMVLVYLLDRCLKRVEDRFFDWRETDELEIRTGIGA